MFLIDLALIFGALRNESTVEKVDIYKTDTVMSKEEKKIVSLGLYLCFNVCVTFS